MSDFLIKGTVTGFDFEAWKSDQKLLPSFLLSIMQTWFLTTYDNHGNIIIETTKEQEREYGKIKNAYWGFESDLHNLAVNYHLLSSLLNDSNIAQSMKSLYITLLIENYIANIRSSYDFCSFFPKIIMPMKDIKTYNVMKNSDSLNTFIKYCENKNSTSIPTELKDLMKNSRKELDEIRGIRDSIIHKGKESIVTFNGNEVYFRIPKRAPYGSENALPDIIGLGNLDYPLKGYLRELTVRLLTFTENLAVGIFEELKKNETYKVSLTALSGLCIKDFNDFIRNEKIRSS